MEDYIGARVDYEPKYKDVLTYFQNIGNLYTWEADPWYETCKSWAETCYIHAGISGAEITFQGKDSQAFLSKLCMNSLLFMLASICMVIMFLCGLLLPQFGNNQK